MPVFIKIIMNRSHIYDIKRPRPREGLEFTKYKNYPKDDANMYKATHKHHLKFSS